MTYGSVVVLGPVSVVRGERSARGRQPEHRAERELGANAS